MFIRKPVAYLLLVVVLLFVGVAGAYTASAQTPTPAAAPVETPAAFQPILMMDAMTAMLEQMDGLLAATEHDAHIAMAPALVKMLEGMTELSQPVTEQIHGQAGPDHEAQLARMTESVSRMQAMTERIHGMMGHGGAAAPAAGEDHSAHQAAPAAEDQSAHQAAPEAAPTDSMSMGQNMQMMSEMMGMMSQMMEKMSQMQGMMGEGMMGGKGMMNGKGMMGGEGMGKMNAGSPVTDTAKAANPSAAADETAPQSVEGGGVTVEVTPLTLSDAEAATLDFAISLDTHTVELDYDLAQLVTLTDNLGNEYTPATWTPEGSDGHHVGGVLSFADRATIVQSGVTELTLNVAGVAEVAERLFVWAVGE